MKKIEVVKILERYCSLEKENEENITMAVLTIRVMNQIPEDTWAEFVRLAYAEMVERIEREKRNEFNRPHPSICRH